MNRTLIIASVLALVFAARAQHAQSATSDSVELKGPISVPGALPASPVTTSAPADPATATAATSLPAIPAGIDAVGGLAPGEDGTMTQDMIYVTPANANQPVGKPLRELASTTLKIQIDRSDIVFEKLRGVLITVTNNTNRPIVVDGDRAKAIIAGQECACVPVSAIQLAIVPRHTITRDFEDVLTHIVPAAITVGAAPTIRDYRVSKKPVLERYGPDELRRKIEYSRFGRRILWTQQKVQGIVYFPGTGASGSSGNKAQSNPPSKPKSKSDSNSDTGSGNCSGSLVGARIEIPVTTLFDNKDTAVLRSSP